jgi:hypothetical protein
MHPVFLKHPIEEYLVVLDPKPKPLVTNIIIPMVALPLSQVKEKPKCGKNATATRTKKEMTAVVYVIQF